MHSFPSMLSYEGLTYSYAGHGSEVGIRRYVDLARGRSLYLWTVEVVRLCAFHGELVVLGNPSRRPIIAPRRMINLAGGDVVGARIFAGPVFWEGERARAAALWARRCRPAAPHLLPLAS